MDSAAFRNHIEAVHRIWVAQTLGLCHNNGELGIDLRDPERSFAIELKSKLRFVQGRKQNTFTVHERQRVNYEQDYDEWELYWAFLRYGLSTPIKSIAPYSTTDDLEELVGEREVWIVPWDFVEDNFDISHAGSGTLYRYPHQRVIDSLSYTSYTVPKGIIHLPTGYTRLEDRVFPGIQHSINTAFRIAEEEDDFETFLYDYNLL
jgi:hypothetical protein